jgi:hypothetical protein
MAGGFLRSQDRSMDASILISMWYYQQILLEKKYVAPFRLKELCAGFINVIPEDNVAIKIQKEKEVKTDEPVLSYSKA